MAKYYANRDAQYAQQAALARAALAQQMRLMREAQSDAARLSVADAARAKGDLEAACRIYRRLAGSQPSNPSTVAANERLNELDKEARERLADIDRRLNEWRGISPSEQLEGESLTQLAQCLDDFAALAAQYGDVPEAGRDIRSAWSRQRNQPQARAALFEPDAKSLWEEGQALEAEGQVCCAYLLYEEAARKLPAPSARTAQQRLEQLRVDPANVIAAESCRNLQWCHQQFRLAERVARESPARAREIFAQILERSPVDSSIHAEAQKQLSKLE